MLRDLQCIVTIMHAVCSLWCLLYLRFNPYHSGLLYLHWGNNEFVPVQVNTLRPRKNDHHFQDIFKCIFLNENIWISIKISLKFVPNDLIKNIPALLQMMAWRRSGDKPLSERMVVRLPTYIYVTRPHWVKYPERNHACYRCNMYTHDIRPVIADRSLITHA